MIDPCNAFSHPVSDGALLAIGAQSDFFPVKVYKNIDGGWEKHGDPINYCQVSWRNLAAMKAFYHGYYIALSGNGERLAIGSIFYGVSSATVAEYDSADLVVHTYQWNVTIKSWDIAEDKDGLLSTPRPLFLFETPRAIWPQKCIAFSDDGTVLSVGSEDAINVYFWNKTVSGWTPRDIDLNVTESTSLVG